VRHGTAVIVWAAALALSGCAGGRESQVRVDGNVDVASYRRIGVAVFTDRTGKGRAVADAIAAALQREMFEPVDEKALAQLLARYKPDPDTGFGIEALEVIRSQSGADALLMGRMAADWSAASVNMIETNTGAPVLRGILRPRGKRKAFATPEEVAQEFSRVFAKLR
jgi:hypothetical protein